MSSRADTRRRDRSWERDDNERDRYPRRSDGRRGDRGHHRDDPRRRPSSRSRSPRRDRDDRRGSDRRDRDYKRDDDRRHDSRHDRDRDRDRERERDRERDRNRERDNHPEERRRADDAKPPRKDEPDDHNRHGKHTDEDSKYGNVSTKVTSSAQPEQSKNTSSYSLRPSVDPTTPGEDGETMEEDNADEEAMMSLMGVAGFGSTKGKHVAGNQEGNVNIKKTRTWRQYMNRRGGFNRPLDKIK